MAEALLTAQYCKDALHKLVFHPANLLEATFVAAQLQDLGFKYWREESAKNLANAVTGSIYLDTDKTIMIGTDRKPEGQVCSVASLAGYAEATGKDAVDLGLTREDCHSRTLVFYPRNFSEAFRALSVLTDFGVKPRDEAAGLAPFIARATGQGLVVREGIMSLGPTSADLPYAKILTAADFGLLPIAPQPDNNTLLSAFNEMSARMAQVVARLGALEAEILPKTVEKPKPKLPGQG
jgi:hypothetical protein